MPQPEYSLLSNESNVTYQARYEGTDASENTSTAYTISAGDTFSGALSSTTDEDYIRVYLEAGTEYEFAMGGSDIEAGTLRDPYLRLRDSNDGIVAQNDDLGIGYLSSYFTYVPSSSGYYFIEADAYADASGATYTGTYTLGFDAIGTVTPPEPAFEATLDELADYLTTGYWEDNGETPAAFDTRSSNVITVNLGGLDAIGRRFAEAALEAWEMVADIDFQVVSGTAEITFTDNGTLSAYSTSQVDNGYITSAVVNVSTDWVRTPYVDVTGDYDDYGLQTYIHELGHALGLGHMGPYNGDARYGTDNLFTNDSWMTTVMSYFSQTDNTDVDGTYAYVMTAMSADIIAIQELYGAAREDSVTWGRTTWGHNSNLGTYLDDLFDAATGGSQANVGTNAVTFTVYDAGGIDIINLSTMEVDIDLNLGRGQSSSIGNLTNVVHIARNTFIENAYLGSGDDEVRGNNVRNWIRSGDGDDMVYGNGGDDRLILGNGNDRGYGGNNNDFIAGGAGNDSVFGGNGNDTLQGNLGNDIMYGGNGSDNIKGGNGHDRLFGGAQNDVINGEFGNDRIVDGFGNDRIYGGFGRDTIVFSQGNDTATGGGGVDYFVFGANDGQDRVTDFTLGTDILRLDDALWSGSMSAEEIIDTYASVGAAGQTIFTFDGGEVLTLTGVSDLDALENSLVII